MTHVLTSYIVPLYLAPRCCGDGDGGDVGVVGWEWFIFGARVLRCWGITIYNLQ